MELIKVTTNNNGIKVVSARELHEGLEIGTRYDTWFNRMCEYGFEENQDYVAIAQKRATAQGNLTTYVDHAITLDMAKHIAMIQRSELGMKFRNYFIECEKQLTVIKESYRIDDPIERAKAWIAEEEERRSLALAVEEAQPKVIAYDTFMNADGTYSVTNVCKMLGLQRAKVFAWLREEGLVFQRKTEATVKGINKGYFRQVVKGCYSTMVVTAEGVEYIRNNFEEVA